MEVCPQRAREYGELIAEQHVPGMEVSYYVKLEKVPISILCGTHALYKYKCKAVYIVTPCVHSWIFLP